MQKINFQNSSLKISAGLPEQFPRDRAVQIAFSGRSNAGKSSLINALLGRKALARVSSAPGKTITVNFYNVDEKLYFVDLPGYGFAKRPPEEKKRWSELTDGYFTKNPNIDLLKCVVQLVDSRIGPTEDDMMMLRFLSGADIPFIVAAAKSDKLNKTQRSASEKLITEKTGLDGGRIIYFSAVSGEGKNELIKKILELSGLN